MSTSSTYYMPHAICTHRDMHMHMHLTESMQCNIVVGHAMLCYGVLIGVPLPLALGV